ncbi:hypothetical protein K439DRAFT_1620232 [Ramaria rubella]|nr:hypothetical protein K439DRAFT_1620232 [Ramaria rubella]
MHATLGCLKDTGLPPNLPSLPSTKPQESLDILIFISLRDLLFFNFKAFFASSCPRILLHTPWTYFRGFLALFSGCALLSFGLFENHFAFLPLFLCYNFTNESLYS